MSRSAATATTILIGHSFGLPPFARSVFLPWERPQAFLPEAFLPEAFPKARTIGARVNHTRLSVSGLGEVEDEGGLPKMLRDAARDEFGSNHGADRLLEPGWISTHSSPSTHREISRIAGG